MSVEYAVRVSFTVDGRPLQPELAAYVEQIIVDDNLHLPDMFSITFVEPPERDMLNRAGLAVKAKVEIWGAERGSPDEKPLITGEVTALEADYDALGRRVTARGYDFSHRLHGGPRTVLYTDASDSEIVRKIADRAGIELGDIEPTAQVHAWLSQANQTDWDFLTQRAQAIGFEVAVTGGKLYFRSPERSASAPAEGDLNSTQAKQLVLGRNLIEFHARVSGAEQVAEIEVRGWDPEKKEALVATAPAGTVAAETETATPSELAQKFGSQKFVLVDRPLRSGAEADALARSMAERIGSAFAEADGIAEGSPELRAGAAVSVAGVGGFPGRYVLSHTRHVFDRVGYRTHFSITGRQQRSLHGLFASMAAAGGGSAGNGRPAARMPGLARAIVTDNNDPLAQGRVRIKFPWLSDDYDSPWAPVAQLGAGPDSGAVFIPEVGDEVLVGFEGGSLNFPLVVGGLYNGVDKPRLGDALIDNGRVTRRGFVSRRGHRFVFFDDERNSGIALISASGRLKLALNETGGELHLHADGAVRIDAGGALKVESGSQLTLKGASGIKIESGGIVDIDGAVIQLN